MAQILPSADDADWTSQDIVENESGDREPRRKWTHAVTNHNINAAANEHPAALHVHGANREAKEHHADYVPRCRFSNRSLGNTPGVEHRGREIAQNDRGASPIADER